MCSYVVRNEARSVVRRRALRPNDGTVCEAVCHTNQWFSTIHNLGDRTAIFLPLRVQFDAYGFRTHIIKEDLNLEEILLTLLLNGCRTESKR